MTYSISVPLVTAVVVSNLVVNHESYWAGVTGQISAVKGFAMSCVPVNQLEQSAVPAPLSGAGEAVAQPACKEAVERMSRLLDTPVVPRVFMFRGITVLGEIERCVGKIVDTTAGIVKGTIDIFRTNPVVTVTRNTASFVQAFFSKFMSDARDKSCAAKQSAEGTYEMKVAFLKSLLKQLGEKEGGFDVSVLPHLKGLIHVLSYQVRYLSKDMVDLLIAYDVLANSGGNPFDELRLPIDSNSQAVAGSPPLNFVQRALQELELRFHTPSESHGMVLGVYESDVPMDRGAQQYLPTFSDDELKLWGDLLVRKQRAGTAAPSGHTPFVSIETAQAIEERRLNPFYNFFKAIRADGQLQELERAPETMPQLKPLMKNFNEYVEAERLRLGGAGEGGEGGAANPLLDVEVEDADSASKIAGEAAAVMAGCDDEGSVDNDDDDDGDDVQRASTKKRRLDDSGSVSPFGGKSRSRKRSVVKRTRRKGAAKKQQSKKNKRQSRRKVRRSCSRKSRK